MNKQTNKNRQKKSRFVRNLIAVVIITMAFIIALSIKILIFN